MRIVIADDDMLVSGALRTILEKDQDIEVQGIASNGKEAIELYRKYEPDVLLMDIRMSPMSGLEASEEILKENCTDYVTVILTDKADLDVIDMQERIRLAFPNLLEIRRENQRKADYSRALQTEELLDPYELCCSFLKEINEEEKAILQDVLHTVQGVK